jgi:hypothetical protein
MSEATLIAHCGTTKVSREELKMISVPESTRTFKPIPHYEIVDALVEALSFRHIGVVRDEYAVSPDGMRMFGGPGPRNRVRWLPVCHWHSQCK